MTTVIEGKVHGIKAETLAACLFRIGGLSCAAFASVAEDIICHNGYAGHTVRAQGTVTDSKEVVVTALEVID